MLESGTHCPGPLFSLTLAAEDENLIEEVYVVNGVRIMERSGESKTLRNALLTWIIDVDLVRVDSNDRPILLVKFSNPPGISALVHHIIVELVPERQYCKLRTWNMGDWAQIESVDGTIEDVGRQRRRCQRKNHPLLHIFEPGIIDETA